MMPMRLDRAILDKRLLGASLEDLSTWRNWITVLHVDAPSGEADKF